MKDNLAELNRHLNQRVRTPKGSGRLIQVFAARVGVVLDGQRKVSYIRPDLVKVLPEEGANQSTEVQGSRREMVRWPRTST